jgi:DNA repair exonuclease SbcCD ATPase subunit
MQKHERHLNEIAERLKRVEEAHKHKATPKGSEEENGFDDLEFKLKLLEFKVEDLDDLYSQLEELRGDVEDLQGQLADAESRIDELESANWP